MERETAFVAKALLPDVDSFTRGLSRIRLRSYQVQVARAVVDSITHGRGHSFVVVFPRQSGKNELQAQLEVYLLCLYCTQPMEMIKVSPTWKPQSINAMRRLERVLRVNPLTRWRWIKRSGYIYQVGDAMIHFLSGSPTTSIVGATASLLLECDEAQDVEIAKWDKEIAPMAASTNATRIFWGTAWTSRTLLARELQAARLSEQQDQFRRTWVLTADDVGAQVPSYRKFVAEQVARLGRGNPLVRTQYFSEQIDAEGSMFPLSRRLLMAGAHPRQSTPQPGQAYVFTIDVAGQDEAATGDLEHLANPARDSTVLTIFQVDASDLGSLIKKPTYHVVSRLEWQGVKHSTLYSTITSLADIWAPVRVIIDATGVGAGLASFLLDRLGTRLVPFEFSQVTKSQLGWDFLTTVDTGRYKEFHPFDPLLQTQLEYCQYSILEGPGKLMRWGVPSGTRDVATGELVHDDYVISAALISVMDHETWGVGLSQVVRPPDILEGLRF